jgi:acetyl esterase/lipase
MKRLPYAFFAILFSVLSGHATAQTVTSFSDIFPKGTRVYENIHYADDTLKKHQLDIYLPAENKLAYPLIIWVHGGAWMSNDKHADMSYMVNTIRNLINSGFALASIDYRWSTTAPFPAQIQDCNAAIDFLAQNAAQYNIDDGHVVLMGFSAGGHLASLAALSENDNVRDFYYKGKKPTFKISGVIDFYGPADLLTLKGNDNPDPKNPINLLLGGSVASNPKLAKKASPITYVDLGDPPFLIIQGEKDQSVNPEQATELAAALKHMRIKNKVIIVPGAPHFGPMFDSESNWEAIKAFLDDCLQ